MKHVSSLSTKCAVEYTCVGCFYCSEKWEMKFTIPFFCSVGFQPLQPHREELVLKPAVMVCCSSFKSASSLGSVQTSLPVLGELYILKTNFFFLSLWISVFWLQHYSLVCGISAILLYARKIHLYMGKKFHYQKSIFFCSNALCAFWFLTWPRSCLFFVFQSIYLFIGG